MPYPEKVDAHPPAINGVKIFHLELRHLKPQVNQRGSCYGLTPALRTTIGIPCHATSSFDPLVTTHLGKVGSKLIVAEQTLGKSRVDDRQAIRESERSGTIKGGLQRGNDAYAFDHSNVAMRNVTPGDD